jgi:DNA-binding GntR family transcriptional regulator
MPLDPTRLPRTAEAIAATELRAAIIRGDLAPGAKIRQEATAAELGVSLIPLREALNRLAGEGIVTYLPQRGYFVAELPGSAISAVYEARAVVESATEVLGVPRLTADDLRALRGHLLNQRRAVTERDAVALVASNRRFHFVIFDRAENPWLVRFVAQLWDALEPYRVISYRSMWQASGAEPAPTEIVAEHREIVAALESRETSDALRLLELHRRRSEALLLALGDSPEAWTL